MFNLSTRERFVILFLMAALLTGLSVILYQKHNPVVDVKVRAFDYEPAIGNIEKIDINEADESMLMELPGVGKSLAGRIIEYRDREGSFRSIEEIKKVRGIKENLFEKIKDQITIE